MVLCQLCNEKFRKVDNGIVKFMPPRVASAYISWTALLLAIASVASLSCLKLVWSSANLETTGPVLFSVYFFCGILGLLGALFTINRWTSRIALVLVCVDIYFFLFEHPTLWIS